MINSLFDLEEEKPLEVSAAVLRRRALDRERQRRCRERKLKRAQGVTPEPGSVTGDLFSVTPASQAVTDAKDEHDFRVVMEAVSRAASAKQAISRPNIERHLREIAREKGWHIFDAAQFLTSAVERGHIPARPPETVVIARDVLRLLVERTQQ